MTGLRLILCLAALNLTVACVTTQPEPVISYAEQPPVPQSVNIELPSAPTTQPDTTPHDIRVDNTIQTPPERSNCQIGFEQIMAEATKKIDTQRHM